VIVEDRLLVVDPGSLVVGEAPRFWPVGSDLVSDRML